MVVVRKRRGASLRRRCRAAGRRRRRRRRCPFGRVKETLHIHPSPYPVTTFNPIDFLRGDRCTSDEKEMKREKRDRELLLFLSPSR